MILKNCDMESLHNKIKNNTLVCFGVGTDLKQLIRDYQSYNWQEKIFALIDNDVKKHKQIIKIKEKEFVIEPVEKLLIKRSKDMVILITCSYYYEIVKQLNNIKELDETECYIYHFMQNLLPDYKLTFEKEKGFKIPKTIHYCWFGKNPLPDFYQKCIESWRKYCPEYEILEWNESNCDISENLYASQAYKNKKYGFVPDYFRLKIIYENGGVYLDTDVELIKNLDDLRYNEAFCGLQLPGEVAFGLGFGACKGNKVIKKLLDRYKNLIFEDEKGNLNETISPVYQTDDLIKLGMKLGNKLQKIEEMVIYPTDVLSPKNLLTNLTTITTNTYAIHHFDGSWLSGERLLRKEKRLKEAKEIEKMFKL